MKQQAELGAGSILVQTSASSEKALVDLRVEVIRTVAAVKQADNQAKAQAKARRDEAARLDAIIAEREVAEATLDQLKARRAALA